MDDAKLLLSDLWDQRRFLPEPERRHPRLRELYVVVIHPGDLRKLRVHDDHHALSFGYPEDRVFGFEIHESLAVAEGTPRLMLREDAEAIVAEHATP